MALDLKYVLAPSLQEYFVDKDTGLPLAGGIVTFYSDNNRTVLKNVYEITGSPPDYTFSPLPNPITLSSVGTMQDAMGNDILPYYYPYDDNGDVELYYITVESSEEVPQFTREAYPSGVTEASPDIVSQIDLLNYVPNPQFLIHYTVPGDDLANPVIQTGQIVSGETALAPGGWYFERPDNSTALDLVRFTRFGAYVTPPPPAQSPRYACRVTNNGVSISDSYKSLSLRFLDVNKFGSPDDVDDPLYQPYTYSFVAQSLGGSFDVDLYLRKYYGSGTSSGLVETYLTTFTITTSETIFTNSFSFGTNEGEVIGNNDDDYVEVCIYFPTSQTFDVAITDAILTPNNVEITNFPATTDGDMLSRSLVPVFIPSPDGSDLYLPLQWTRDGLAPDYGQVGMIYSGIVSQAPPGYLVCDGARYERLGYSEEGIPYNRFWQKTHQEDNALQDTGLQPWGNGVEYATVSRLQAGTDSTHLLLITNKAGAQTDTADGATATGFVFETIVDGRTDPEFKGFVFNGNNVYCITTAIGIAFDETSAGDSGFTVNLYEDQSGASGRPGTDSTNQIATIEVTALPDAGTFFKVSSTTTEYVFWFNKDGTGSAPAETGTLVEIKYHSATMNTSDLATIIAATLSGFQVTYITVNKTGSTLTAGSYFSFHADSQQYVPWYVVNNVGVQPAVPGAIFIPITIQTSYTTSDVGKWTLINTNDKYMSTPDLRGIFLRGFDGLSGIDPGVLYRYSHVPNLYGNKIGTFQIDALVSHKHDVPGFTAGGQELFSVDSNNNDSGSDHSVISINTGSAETRPINFAVNYLIKI